MQFGRGLLYTSLASTLISCSGQINSATGLFNASNTTASTCIEDSASRSLASYSISDKCETPNNYVCESNTSSGAASVEKQCATVTGMGQVCLTVDIASWRKGPFHCANTGVTNPSGFSIQSNGSTLAEALNSAVNKCRTRTL